MLNITSEQLIVIKKYLPDCLAFIPSEDLDSLLDNLDDVITDIGFDSNYELTDEGLKLQKIYDQIYNQNK